MRYEKLSSLDECARLSFSFTGAATALSGKSDIARVRLLALQLVKGAHGLWGMSHFDPLSAPNRIRTGVTGLKSPCPRPLDDGGKPLRNAECEVRNKQAFTPGNERILPSHRISNSERRTAVTPPRLERGTYSLEGCCSIQLSYGANQLPAAAS